MSNNVGFDSAADGVAECRICLLPQIEPFNFLLTICHCKGTHRYIHRTCFVKDLLSRSSTSLCSICHASPRRFSPLAVLYVVLLVQGALVHYFWGYLYLWGMNFSTQHLLLPIAYSYLLDIIRLKTHMRNSCVLHRPSSVTNLVDHFLTLELTTTTHAITMWLLSFCANNIYEHLLLVTLYLNIVGTEFVFCSYMNNKLHSFARWMHLFNLVLVQYAVARAIAPQDSVPKREQADRDKR